jgi:hypothetical protein
MQGEWRAGLVRGTRCYRQRVRTGLSQMDRIANDGCPMDVGALNLVMHPVSSLQ